MSRRSLLQSAGLALAGATTSGPVASLLPIVDSDADAGTPWGVNVANARGLVQFPCKPGDLLNTYHMMRAGESAREAEGIMVTNPVSLYRVHFTCFVRTTLMEELNHYLVLMQLFLTNKEEDSLTELGVAQMEEACNEMMSVDINPSVVKYSLAAKCLDSANIVATKMMVGRNRIVPEFTFMGESMAL